MAKKNGKEENGKQLMLSKEERLELQNIDLQRKLLEAQAQQQISILEARQREVAEAINSRLGINIMEYQINIQTGLLTKAQEPLTAALAAVPNPAEA